MKKMIALLSLVLSVAYVQAMEPERQEINFQELDERIAQLPQDAANEILKRVLMNVSDRSQLEDLYTQSQRVRDLVDAAYGRTPVSVLWRDKKDPANDQDYEIITNNLGYFVTLSAVVIGDNNLIYAGGVSQNDYRAYEDKIAQSLRSKIRTDMAPPKPVSLIVADLGGKILLQEKVVNTAITAIDVNSNYSQVVLGTDKSDESSLVIYDLKSGEITQRFDTHNKIKKALFSSDNKRVYAIEYTGTSTSKGQSGTGVMTTWDIKSGMLLKSIPFTNGLTDISVNGNAVAVTQLLPDDKIQIMWGTLNNKESADITIIASPDAYLQAVALLHKGNKLLLGFQGPLLMYNHDTNDTKQISDFLIAEKGLIISRDDSAVLAVAGSGGNLISIIDGSPIFEEYEFEDRPIAMSKNGMVLLHDSDSRRRRVQVYYLKPAAQGMAERIKAMYDARMKQIAIRDQRMLDSRKPENNR